MRYPSIKTLVSRLGVTKETAEQLRALMRNEVADNELPAETKTWLYSCHNRPDDDELAMSAIDAVLGNYGVEALRAKKWVSAYYGDVAYTYSNTGDTYAATIVHNSTSGQYSVTSWGDVVEAHPYMFE